MPNVFMYFMIINTTISNHVVFFVYINILAVYRKLALCFQNTAFRVIFTI